MPNANLIKYESPNDSSYELMVFLIEVTVRSFNNKAKGHLYKLKMKRKSLFSIPSVQSSIL